MRVGMKSGKFSYSQRLELGELFSSDKAETEKFKEVFSILHGIELEFESKREMEFYSEYFEEIVEGVLFG